MSNQNVLRQVKRNWCQKGGERVTGRNSELTTMGRQESNFIWLTSKAAHSSVKRRKPKYCRARSEVTPRRVIYHSDGQF